MRLDEIRPYFHARLDPMVERLKEFVEFESPSRDKARLDRLASRLETLFAPVCTSVERVSRTDCGDHLVLELDTNPKSGAKPILVLCHFDTVWPAGTLERRPVRIEEGRLHGPGCYDMKASLVLTLFAFQAIHESAPDRFRPIRAIFTSDEEVGSLNSRSLIEEHARNSEYVLVLEPPLSRGECKTARKGVGRFTIEVEGRSTHAGVEPEKGANAIVELAARILEIHKLNDYSSGTTLNVGVIEGGTVSNVVPDGAVAHVDARVWTTDEAERVQRALNSIAPTVPGTRTVVRGGFNRPPMERTPGNLALFERARLIAASLGFNLAEGSTGGGSDANFTSALGVPTLDGLGTMGSGAHAENEHIVIESMADRAALLFTLLTNLN